MSQHLPPVFQRTLQESVAWLDELVLALPGFDRDDALHLLRAVLHPLRDELPPAEVMDLASQLPMLLRGMFLEGWRPAATHPRITREGLAIAVWRQMAERLEATDHPLEGAIYAVRRLLNHRISAGELRHVRQVLPGELRTLFAAQS